MAVLEFSAEGAPEIEKIELTFAGGEVEEYGSLSDLQGDKESFQAAIRAAKGDELLSMKYWVKAYRNNGTDHPVVPAPDSLEALSRSLVGAAYTKDHNKTTDHHGGDIIEAKAEGDDVLARVDVRESRLQLRALKGNIRGHSIGFGFSAAKCSSCGKQARLRGNQVVPQCSCGTQFHAENPRADHLAATPFPRVAGTGIISASFSQTEEKDMSNGKGQVNLAEVQAELAEAVQERDQLQVQLSEQKVKYEELSSQNDELTTQLSEANRLAKDFALEVLEHEKRLVGDQAQDEEIQAIFSSLGLKRAVNLIRTLRSPQVELSDDEIGEDPTGDPRPPKGSPSGDDGSFDILAAIEAAKGRSPKEKQ